jgi:serine protease Do
MKQIIKNLSFVFMVLILMAPVSLMAQKDDKVKEKEKKDGGQIIISRNGDNKVVVEVDGDKVTVNGKPIEDYKGDDVVILHNKIKDIAALNGYGQLFDNYGGNYRAFTLDANRAMLGVVTEKADKGAEIQEITKESGAEKAGLKKGDIITKVDNTSIESPDDLSKAIKEHKPGDKVSVTYLRDKKEQKATAELTKWKGVTAFGYGEGNQNFGMTLPDMNFERIVPRVQAVPRTQFNWSWSGGSPKMGLSIQDTEDGKGVKVVDVDDESNAAKAGIKEDDIITEVEGKTVNSTDEVTKIIKESKDKVSVKMKLLRNGKTETVDVKIPRRLKTADL